MSIDLCWCGKPLHYTDQRTYAQVKKIVDKFGEFMDVKTTGGRIFRVQRHFIALHGLRGQDLIKQGFKEVK